MKRFLTALFQRPWYFLAFAASPVLTLLAHNIAQIRPEAGLRSIVLVLCLAGATWLVLRLALRHGSRASFAASAVFLLFFSYGHVIDFLHSRLDLAWLESILAGLWCLLGVLALCWAGAGRMTFARAAVGLNLVALALVVVPGLQVAYWSLPRATPGPAAEHAPLQPLMLPQGEAAPDIYYIIIDSYGRSDLLRQVFELDNSSFIQRLEQLGFFVADQAQSNYNRTDVSLGSSLNLDYLQVLDDEYQPGNLSRRTLWESIRNNAARYQLEQLGYRTVAFASGFSWSEWTDADVYFSPSPFLSSMTGFETLLVRTTPLRHLQDAGWINLDEIDGQRYRERTELIFASMQQVARLEGPKFVFLHIIPPHPPFIYAPDGTPTDPARFLNEDHRYSADSYKQGYRNQAAFISDELLYLVETLLASSAQPPVIILQGDHAPWLQTGYRRFLVLNAYYLPEPAAEPYPAISPVNTFRLVFNSYFGTDYEILPDISYYSPVPDIYAFEEIPPPDLDP